MPTSESEIAQMRKNLEEKADLSCLILEINPPRQSTFDLKKPLRRCDESIRFGTHPRHPGRR